MAREIDNFEILQEYFSGVVKRAECHAPNVTTALYPLLGLVVLYHDKEQILEVREYSGEMANILWFFRNGKRFALVYNHTANQIEIRERTQGGTRLCVINNDTSIDDLKNYFENL